MEFDAKPVTCTMPNPVLERPIEQIEKVISEAEEKQAETHQVAETEQKTENRNTAIDKNNSDEHKEYKPEKIQSEPKRRIRIAVARKK